MSERDSAMRFLSELLRALTTRRADSLHLSPELPPTLIIDGKSVALTSSTLNAHHTREMCMAVMPPGILQEFESNNKCNFELPGSNFAIGEIASFRISIWRIQSDFSLTIERAVHKKHD